MDLLTPALLDPSTIRAFDDAAWNVFIQQARSANLLAHIADQLAERGQLSEVPAAPRQHLIAANALARRQEIAVRWEIDRLLEAFSEAKLPLVLLKGSAYLAARLPAARGRLFSDIDLLVPRSRLDDAESALMLHGWASTRVSAYDERYYRRWMHELPPMEHRQRQSSLDVHHNILPLTTRHPPDAALLLNEAVELPHMPGVHVLAPADMVLHSACHLFHEGELANGLRDLTDVDSLLRQFGAEAGFWEKIAARALQLHLQRPLFYALHLTSSLLRTPVPSPVLAAVDAFAPKGLRRAIMDGAYARALRPEHPSANDRWTSIARTFLYLRSHYLKMPPTLLVYHLARKGCLRLLGLDDQGMQKEEQEQRR